VNARVAWLALVVAGLGACVKLLSIDDVSYATAPDAGTTCDAPLAIDPLNCGACGHECFGGACDAGRCQPIAIASAPGAQSVAVDDKYVYWATMERVGSSAKVGAGSLWRAEKSDVAKRGLLKSAISPSPRLVRVNTSTIYFATWWDPGAMAYVESCPLSGCGAGPTILSQTIFLSDFVLASDRYYTVSYDGTFGGVYDALLDGGGADVLVKVGYPEHVALAGGYAYWTVGNGVSRCDPSACDAGAWVTVGDGTHYIAADDANVFFTVDAGDILRADPGAVVTTFASAQGLPVALVDDGTALYWANQSTGEIMMEALDGGAGPVTLATGQASPTWIALDDASVYWANADPDAGAIVRLAR
jgi:hypothetical protein